MGDSQVGPALRWLAHPVTLAAIGVMVLNDHVLKGAFGSWWTGKLSDVAGLVFFPALVAVVLAACRAVCQSAPTRPPAAPRPGAPADRLVFASAAITGLGFAWVKATWAGAAAASAVLSALAGPSVVRADASDLLALPALGVAVWVGLGRRRARRARRALVAVALPAALLASVATSAADDPFATVVVDDTGAAQAYVDHVEPVINTVRFAYADGAWRPLPDASLYAAGVPVPSQTQACVPASPEVCFRAIPEAVGVQRSDDGGATWVDDWRLTPAQVRELETAYGKAGVDLWTQGLGVVPTEAGYVVIAGNGVDGFAVRGEDGAWERVGFEGMDCCSWAKAAPLGSVADLPARHALPVWVLLGVAVATLALPWVGVAARRRAPAFAPVRMTAAAWVVYGLGAALGLGLIAANVHYGPLTRRPIAADALMLAFGGGAAVVAVVVASQLAGLFRRQVQADVWLGWLVGFAAAGGASALVPRGLGWQALAAVGGAAVAYPLLVWWARGWWARFVARQVVEAVAERGGGR